MQDDVKQWFDALPAAHSAQLLRLRAVIMQADPSFVEAIKWGQPCYSKSGVVCYLQKARAHVALGFAEGARLTDPKGRLVGSGKQMRHIKFGLQDSVDSEDLGQLVAQAIALNGARE